MAGDPTRPSDTLARIDADAASKAARHEYVTGVGQRIAAELRADPDMFQEYAALKAGISRATYYRWLEDRDPVYEDFQTLVNSAVYEAAKHAEGDAEMAIGCTEQGSSAWANWHKWKLEKRFRKIYGDLAQAPLKVAMTDSEGNDLAQVPTTALIGMLAATKEGDGE